VAYFRPSEIFVNGIDWRLEAGPYPIERASIFLGENHEERVPEGGLGSDVVEKLRMGVDIVAAVLTSLRSP
jgi:hypothetical protein